jgi:hypothetical protein
MRAFLIDRDGRFGERNDALPTLLALPAALGLNPALPGTTDTEMRPAR